MFTSLLTESPDQRPARASRIARTAARIEAATPTDRDRLVDAIRVVAMLVVAFGHWLVADVVVLGDGTVRAQDVLQAVPWTRALTLGAQVMGLFFVVSGFASAASLVGGARPGWVADRARRLVRPVAAYVAVWTLLVAVLPAAVGGTTAELAGRAVAVHLWFVAVVLLLFALTPALLAAWRATGWWVPAGLTVAAAAVDVLHRIVGVPLVGWVNFAIVWATAVVLGFAWFDGSLSSRRRRWALAVGGAIGTAALVATPWIGLSMVGVGDAGSGMQNTFPPSVVLVTLTAAHLGIVLLLEAPLRRTLARTRVWAAVVLAGSIGMRVYLWHLTALVLGVGVLLLVGGNGGWGAAGTAGWWATRPVWVGLLLVLVAPLVALTARTERAPRRSATGPVGVGRTLAAVGLGSWGTARLALGGFAGSPLASVAVLVAAALLGRGTGTRRAAQ